MKHRKIQRLFHPFKEEQYFRESKGRLQERNRDTIRERERERDREREGYIEIEREKEIYIEREKVERRIYSKYWWGRTLIVPGSVMFSSMSIVHGITSSREAVLKFTHSPHPFHYVFPFSLSLPTSFMAVFVILLLCDFNLLTKPQTSSAWRNVSSPLFSIFIKCKSEKKALTIKIFLVDCRKICTQTTYI